MCDMKVCIRCGKEKGLSEFTSISGKRTDMKLCLDCRRRKRMLESKRKKSSKTKTCKDDCIRYRNSFYPCSRYPSYIDDNYSKIELACSCIDFKQK